VSSLLDVNCPPNKTDCPNKVLLRAKGGVHARGAPTVTLRDVQPVSARLLFSGWLLELRVAFPLFRDPVRTVLAVEEETPRGKLLATE
jgi:hypothetical protein